jgi:multidrug efflux pump subunit AcrA (membrane-fusion protein)
VELAPHAEERPSPAASRPFTPSTFAPAPKVIVQRHFQDGQYVNQGDPLFTLDDAQPRRAGAGAGRAEKRAGLATPGAAAADRYEQLKNNHSISRNDVDTARMQRDVAAAAVEQAGRASPSRLRSATRIASPVTGRVGHSLSRRRW